MKERGMESIAHDLRVVKAALVAWVAEVGVRVVSYLTLLYFIPFTGFPRAFSYPKTFTA